MAYQDPSFSASRGLVSFSMTSCAEVRHSLGVFFYKIKVLESNFDMLPKALLCDVYFLSYKPIPFYSWTSLVFWSSAHDIVWNCKTSFSVNISYSICLTEMAKMTVIMTIFCNVHQYQWECQCKSIFRVKLLTWTFNTSILFPGFFFSNDLHFLRFVIDNFSTFRSLE